MSETLSLWACSKEFLKNPRFWLEVVGSRIFSTVLKICQRSSLVNLGVWEAAKPRPGFQRPEISSASSSPLRELSLEGINVATKAWSRQKRPRFFSADMVILRNSKAIMLTG